MQRSQSLKRCSHSHAVIYIYREPEMVSNYTIKTLRALNEIGNFPQSIYRKVTIAQTFLFVRLRCRVFGKGSITLHTFIVFNTQMIIHVTNTIAFSIKTLITYMASEVSSRMNRSHVTITCACIFKSLTTYTTFKLPHIRMHHSVQLKTSRS